MSSSTFSYFPIGLSDKSSWRQKVSTAAFISRGIQAIVMGKTEHQSERTWRLKQKASGPHYICLQKAKREQEWWLNCIMPQGLFLATHFLYQDSSRFHDVLESAEDQVFKCEPVKDTSHSNCNWSQTCHFIHRI